jgi:hypothetical protein
MRHIGTLAALLVCATVVADAAEKIQAGPRSGRLLEKTQPKAEFFVEKDRTVTVTFYDEKNKAVPPAEQTATLIAMAKERQSIEFEKKENALVSKSKLPEGDPYPVILQFRQSADAKPQNLRFNLDLSTCGGCKRAEYACACH